MYQITKQFKFSAGHFLESLPDSHPCARQHGHNYLVDIGLQSEHLNNIGFVVDYGDLVGFKDMIDSTLDHKNLNDVVTFNPTAELLANYLFERCAEFWWGAKVISVSVKETDGTSAVYYQNIH